MKNKFFTSIAPYLLFIDKGHIFRKPLSWLYTLIAIINILLPLYIVYLFISNIYEIIDETTYVLVFIIFIFLSWVIIAFASWISFQLWWDRKSKLIKTFSEDDDFVATPVFSHFIQTFGEWLGTCMGIVGFGIGLLSFISIDVWSFFYNQFEIDMYEVGLLNIILMPFYGFLIIVSTRFFAEQFRALSSIANNTKKN